MAPNIKPFVLHGEQYGHDARTNTYYKQDRRGRWVPTDPPDESSSEEDDDGEEGDDDDDDDDNDDGEDDDDDEGAAQADDDSSDEDEDVYAAGRAQVSSSSRAALESRMQQMSFHQNVSALGVDPHNPPALINVPPIENLKAGMNMETGVRSLQQSGPPDQITQPELLVAGVQADMLIKDIGSSVEPLNPGYKRRERPTRFFTVHKVFSMMWAEPAGSTLITANTFVGIRGQRVYQKIRRFIVIMEGSRSCTALAIMTHEGRGASGPGVTKSDYGIAYVGKRAPEPLREELPRQGERGLLPHAVRINPDEKTETLEKTSRIDYGRLFTIEHNLPVKSIGVVHDDSKDPFIVQVKASIANRLGKPRRATSRPTTGPSQPMTIPGQSWSSASGSGQGQYIGQAGSSYGAASSLYSTSTGNKPTYSLGRGQPMGRGQGGSYANMPSYSSTYTTNQVYQQPLQQPQQQQPQQQQPQQQQYNVSYSGGSPSNTVRYASASGRQPRSQQGPVQGPSKEDPNVDSRNMTEEQRRRYQASQKRG